MFEAKTWTEEMREAFEEMRSDSEFRATLVYGAFTIIGVKPALSSNYMMSVAANQYQATTSFDAFRDEVMAAGLYLKASGRNADIKRPDVTVNGRAFLVMDCKDDNETDPTVKLILSAKQ